MMDLMCSPVRMNFSSPVQAGVRRARQSEFATRPSSDYGVSGSGGATPIVSPLLQLRLDYENWKQNQEPQVLPDSKGCTEENMAYLSQRYSGPLTMFQKIEALDTMFDMGIIDTEQRNLFYGDLMPATMTAGQASIRSGPLEEDGSFSARMAQMEMELYRLSPLARSETLLDLFSWLDD